MADRLSGSARRPRAPRPYASPSGHLDDWRVIVALWVKRFIVQHGDRMVGEQGTLDDTYVSLNESLAFFQRRLRALPSHGEAAGRERTLDGLAGQLAEHEARMAARVEATAAAGRALPLEMITSRFGLSPAESSLVVCLAALESDVGLQRVCRYALADNRRTVFNVGFIHELLSPTAERHAALWPVWSPDSTLRWAGLVRLEPDESKPRPLFDRQALLWPRLGAFIRGEITTLDARLAGFAAQIADGAPLDTLVLDPVGRAAVERVLALDADGRGPARLLLVGPQGIGKRAVAGAVGVGRERQTIAVDLSAMAPEAEGGSTALAERLSWVLSEARLLDAPLFLDLSALDTEADARVQRVARRLAERLGAHPGPLIFGSDRPMSWLHDVVDGLHAVELAFPERPALSALWRRSLPDWAEADRARVEQTYRLPPGGVVRAAAEAVNQLRAEGDRATPEQARACLWRAARRQLSHRLGALAEPVVTELTLADVVLPEQLEARIGEILDYARMQRTVLDGWGFGRKMGYGQGLAVLFSGPPGTGKTLVSAIIARTLGRELFRVDVARVVDKYIGETEKNIGRIFDEAERAQAILLFDEADSLFATRTSVDSSNDRYANLEVNYLLQRMEQFAGMSILTTNLDSSLDAAVKRRLRFTLFFEMPEAPQRALLWRTLIPAEAADRLDDDIDWASLGELFEISGGYIKNAVLRAAMAAAADEGRITHAHLHDAAVRVYEETGRIAPKQRRRRRRGP